MNTQAFERKLSEAFEGGAIRRRELRLERSEADRLRAQGAQVRELASSGDGASAGGTASSEGKFWYEISFQGENLNGTLRHS